MASNTIKGLTVEIGGDTTKLGKALEDVNKKSSGLSRELGDINRLLKLDPGNTELLAQKQKVLAEAIANTRAKLDTLREAEKQVQQQFERGEISEEQYRALQREIIATEGRLNSYESALNETTRATDDLSDSTETAEEKSGKFGAALKSAAVAAAAAAAAAGAAAVALGKSVVNAYADYEQLVGGVDTLFKDSSEQVQQYADNAYKTAGLSANEYMETVTSFSASLISSLSGDTAKAAQYADMAITDMSDNANKMGTDIGSLQQAYQGFAKQNYTMLDNLKLGYGGTKEEMERLLADATAISGIEYDVSSYADVVDAIHVIQTEMEITGTTAKEAEGTISGSISTLKGSLTNLVAGLGNADADVAALAQNVIDAFKNVISNITPVVDNLIKSLPDVLEAVLEAVQELLPGLLTTVTDLLAKVLALIISTLPDLLTAAADAVLQITDALVEQLPAIIEAIIQIVENVIDALAKALPDIITTITDMIPRVITGLLDRIPDLIQAAVTLLMSIVKAIPTVITSLLAALPGIVDSIVTTLLDSSPLLIDAAIQMFMALVDAIPVIIQSLTEHLPSIINSIITGLVDSIPLLLEGAVQFMMAIVEAIPQIVDALIQAVPQIIQAIIGGLSTLVTELWAKILQPALNAVGEWASNLIENAKTAASNFLSTIVTFFKELPGKIGSFLTNAINKVISWAKEMPAKAKEAAANTLNAIVNGLKALPQKVLDIGRNMVEGLWNGIKNMASWIRDKVMGFADSILGGIKAALGIHSPSTEMAWVGEMLDKGLAKGVEDAAGDPIKAMAKVSQDVLGAAEGVDGLSLDRQLQTSASVSAAAASGNGGIMAKLDRILAAIEAGQVLAIDGDALVGATATKYDSALGQRRLLAARGAI